MLRFGKIYIHLLTIAMFVLFVLNGHITELCIAYISMLLHETAHLTAAVYIGLCVSHISLYPFGVNLKLKNKMVAHLSEEIILYLSGPCMNIILASAALLLKDYFSCFEFAYRVNIMLFCINMLPILPLDGGCIIKRILAGFVGTSRALKIMRYVNIIIIAFIFSVGIYALYITGYNYSILILSVLMIGNIFTQREKYNTEYVRELMFYRDKPLKRIRLTAAYSDEDARLTAKRFMPNTYSIVCRIDRNGKVNELVTERQVIDEILKEKKND